MIKPENLTLDEVLKILKKRKTAFANNLGVTSIGVFGSLL